MSKPIFSIGDPVERCPFCNGKLIRQKKKGQIIKICPNNHKFVVKNPIILRKEKKCTI